MKKLLGQHFLLNKSAIKKIVGALDLKSGDTIIEIGPGAGALTIPLLEECKKLGCKIIAIEKDKKLAYSVQRLASSENLEVIIGDVLQELPKITKRLTPTANRFKVVGNIPYYITGKLLRILGELITNYQLPITGIVLMIQKEVAERIVAKPPKMNLLAAAVQFWAEPKILFTLKPTDFNPPPKVNSAVITLYHKPYTPNPESYYKMIHIIFKQPRKTLFNNLKIGLKLRPNEIEKILKTSGINPSSRPQNLSIADIQNFATLINLKYRISSHNKAITSYKAII